jgi:hypothetical protein
MAVKQYLFRIHMQPITSDTVWFNSVLQDPIELTLNQIELDTVDFVCSLPENTVDLAQQATMLAYAQAVITILSNVWMVTVFELSDDTGADAATPVIVLHPFLSPNLRPVEGDEEYAIRIVKREWESEQQAVEARPGILSPGYGFSSYVLHGAGQGSFGSGIMPDPFTVANIARAVEKGRYQLQLIKKAIAWEDYFIDHTGAYFLNLKGSLSRTRFPLWKATIESLPYGHSGYRVDKEGRLIKQSTALTKRALNGVTNMAQQRRQFIRRDFAINAVLREWTWLCQQFLAWFWRNDQDGVSTPLTWQVYNYPDEPIPNLVSTEVPWQTLSDALPWLIYWLNLVNVAQGDTGLIISLPGATPAQLEAQYQFILDRLRDPDGVMSRYQLRAITAHIEIFRHMVDLTRSIITDLLEFREQDRVFNTTNWQTTGMTFLQFRKAHIDLHNAFALKWPSLVADFYSVFCLACTWQLTFDPWERTRGEDATDVLRSRERPYVPLWKRRTTPISKPALTVALNYGGRFGREYPIFAPFRTWDAQLFDTNYEAAALADLMQQRADAAYAFSQEIALKEAQRQAAALAAWDAYKAAKQAEWNRLNLPNPDDPWDYRNFTSYEWWRKNAQEPLNLQFALRALDVPDELYSWASIALGAAREYIPAFNRDKYPARWTEKNSPAPDKRYPADWTDVFIMIASGRAGVNAYTIFLIVGNAAGEAADQISTDDETYAPRQFWPPINFTW